MQNMAEKSGFSVHHTRRSVVAAAGGTGLAAVLTACGSSDDSSSSSKSADTSTAGAASGSTAPSDTDGDGDGGASSSAPDTSSAPAAGGSALAKTSDIPVGGGQVFADRKVVVTQPTAGQFKGFSAVCTHQGCTVASVSGGTINCPCHGSKFHVADGSVAHGPAASPLAQKPVKVSGDEITLA
jgi:Rieske Fe-S protein